MKIEAVVDCWDSVNEIHNILISVIVFPSLTPLMSCVYVKLSGNISNHVAGSVVTGTCLGAL